MAIQFQCPSCRQPIEIDDQWAAHPVACPYCQRVVTAPPQSTWPADEVPTAREAGSDDTRPSAVPTADPFSPLPPARSAKGAWALTLACTAVALCILSFVSFFMSLGMAAMQEAGPDATTKEIEQVTEQLLNEGKIPASPLAVASALLGTACGIGGLVLAALTLIRKEGGQGLAIAALIISPLFLFCQVGLVLLMTIHSMRP